MQEEEIGRLKADRHSLKQDLADARSVKSAEHFWDVT